MRVSRAHLVHLPRVAAGHWCALCCAKVIRRATMPGSSSVLRSPCRRQRVPKGTLAAAQSGVPRRHCRTKWHTVGHHRVRTFFSVQCERERRWRCHLRADGNTLERPERNAIATLVSTRSMRVSYQCALRASVLPVRVACVFAIAAVARTQQQAKGPVRTLVQHRCVGVRWQAAGATRADPRLEGAV